jgi:hypothetical protein
MPGIVTLLLLLISLTGPIAIATLSLGGNKARLRRHGLITVAVAAAVAFTLGTYLEVASLPHADAGPSPLDAPVYALANAVLAGIVYLVVWMACLGIRRLLRAYRERYPAQAPVRMNRAQRRSAGKRERRL